MALLSKVLAKLVKTVQEFVPFAVFVNCKNPVVCQFVPSRLTA